ncbi:MAG TPA: DEAD/DEAH box helicase, partial [Candidatus Angelobacter sp.]|nr:DEAD/DEAH box helicase [Candidatus Angelobacter sp.]
MRIRELPLDPQVVTQLEGEGLDQLYPPQEDAIKAGVLEGKNLVLASPTASGKTLVAEICILKHVLERNGKAIYLAPLRALASEKYKEFQRYSSIKKPSGEHLRIGVSTGDYDSSDPWLGRYDIIISTNEKTDSLLRHRAPWMNELSLVVADEIHLLTEHERGPTLEVVLTRLTEINPDIQVLALSATVRNADEVGQWLHAGSVTTDWRPVPLREGIYNLGQLQFNDGSSRVIQGGTKTPVLDIALDVLSSGGQALIFTETRRSAVEMGRKAAIAVKPRLSKIEERSLNTIADRVLSSGEKTRLGEALASQIASGTAFHHAGLTGAHRGIVESAFRDGRIKVLAATPTLCLPAGEEIFGNPGPIAIEKLSSLDRVLTHASLFENVVAPTSRDYNGPLVKVTPWFQLPMRMTPEHRVLKATRKRESLHNLTTNRHCRTFSKPEWTKAGNLRVGDLVMFPRIKEEHDLQHIDLPIQGPLSNQTGVVGEHWARLKVDRLELSPETLEVLGLYIAEGYTGRNGQVMFALNTKETDLTALITGWLNGIGLRSRIIDSDRHRRVVRACSKQLAELLRELCGHEASEKCIPHRLVSLANNQLGHLVRGMWRGDGDIREGRARTVRYSTTSRRLAKQLFAVLVKLGYMPSIKMTRRSGKTSRRNLLITHRQDLYTVSVSGKQLTQFLREVLLTEPEGFE